MIHWERQASNMLLLDSFTILCFVLWYMVPSYVVSLTYNNSLSDLRITELQLATRRSPPLASYLRFAHSSLHTTRHDTTRHDTTRHTVICHSSVTVPPGMHDTYCLHWLYYTICLAEKQVQATLRSLEILLSSIISQYGHWQASKLTY